MKADVYTALMALALAFLLGAVVYVAVRSGQLFGGGFMGLFSPEVSYMTEQMKQLAQSSGLA